MADFCLQCAIEIFGDDNRELAGLCNKGYKVAALCEGCGTIYVDHEGRCMTNCDENHYSKLSSLRLYKSSTNENPTSEIPREHEQNPTRQS